MRSCSFSLCDLTSLFLFDPLLYYLCSSSPAKARFVRSYFFFVRCHFSLFFVHLFLFFASYVSLLMPRCEWFCFPFFFLFSFSVSFSFVVSVPSEAKVCAISHFFFCDFTSLFLFLFALSPLSFLRPARVCGSESTHACTSAHELLYCTLC